MEQGKKGKRKVNFFTRGLLITAGLMIAVNVVFGVLLVLESYSRVREANETRMLDISNTAAATIDGNALKNLKKEDADTPEYQSVLNALRVFQDHVALQYIYCITKIDDDHFVFSVDAAIEDPGEFGSPVVVTDALRQASRGTSAVDKKPYKDDWGEFYSAYSPVFDSDGNVAGIVAVDFSAEQYEEGIVRNALTVFGLTFVALIGGALIVYIVTHRVRERFVALNRSLSSLSDNIEELNEQIVSNPSYRAALSASREERIDEEEKPQGRDEIAKLNAKIDKMQRELEIYVGFIHKMAYTDAMTGVNNKTAYFEKVNALNEDIRAGKASFSVAVFDIDALKMMNDNFGHEYGDRMIVGAVGVMQRVFGEEKLYRIGGDEFIEVLDGATEEDMAAYFAEIDRILPEAQAAEETKDVGFSKGAATYDPATDPDYKSVFKRADERMYEDKQLHHVLGARTTSPDDRDEE